MRIRRLSINATLKSLLLVARIEKSSKSAVWLQNKRCSLMAESSSPLTIFPVIGSIAATILKFVNNNRTLELCMTNGILSLYIKMLIILHLVWKANRILQYGILFFIMRLILVRNFFSIRVFVSRTLTTHRTAGKGGDHLLFHSTTSNGSRTFRHLAALCMWDDYYIFLIAPLVFTRLLLDEIYHLIELPFDWLMMWH